LAAPTTSASLANADDVGQVVEIERELNATIRYLYQWDVGGAEST
jgi:hypothetical protein